MSVAVAPSSTYVVPASIVISVPRVRLPRARLLQHGLELGAEDVGGGARVAVGEQVLHEGGVYGGCIFPSQPQYRTQLMETLRASLPGLLRVLLSAILQCLASSERASDLPLLRSHGVRSKFSHTISDGSGAKRTCSGCSPRNCRRLGWNDMLTWFDEP